MGHMGRTWWLPSTGPRRTRRSSWARARRVPGISFFFQAEDGIRDYKVTGVQTCALPIFRLLRLRELARLWGAVGVVERADGGECVFDDGVREQARHRGGGGSVQAGGDAERVDRKSTRLNSSHLVISYAGFCLKKKKYHRH